MSKTGVVRVMSEERRVPEGGCPQPIPDFAPGAEEERTVLVGGGALPERVCRLPRRLTVEALLRAAGAEADRVKAVYLGWPAGRFFAADRLDATLELDCETVYLADRGECMLDLLARLAEVLRGWSCGRCVFGREGTYQLHLMLSDIAAQKGRETDLERLTELCEAMRTQSACTLGGAAASSVLSALELFRPEIEAHIARKSCPALVCRPFIDYYIEASLCTGCQACADACEEEAIEGRRGFIHVLDRDMCTKCGACLSVCPEGAVRCAGGKVPRGPAKPIPCGAWK